jgi:hypothetical protein
MSGAGDAACACVRGHAWPAFDSGHFLAATGLNPLWLAIGCAAFIYGFHRDRGSPLQQAE